MAPLLLTADTGVVFGRALLVTTGLAIALGACAATNPPGGVAGASSAAGDAPPPTASPDVLPPPPPPLPPAPTAAEVPLLLSRSGEHIIDQAGRPVVLRGVAFGNQVWGHRALPVTHHGEIDFERVRAMGMNAIRFYMYYGTLEDDAAPGIYKPAGWKWLDQNLAWARKHGVYLILNMHVPPGGFQSNGEGQALWDVPANQDRLVALWREIAARYVGQPMVAGYDILNEPGVSKSKAQWQALANRITRAIREVDGRHIVIVERVNSIAKQWTNDADMNFFLVDDPNVVYTFHFYEPFPYTHQLAGWVQMGEGGKYPDETKMARAGDTDWLNIATFDSPRLPAGDTDWTHTEGPRLPATDPRAVIGHVSLVGKKVAGGRVWFDDLVVEEFDGRGNPLGEVLRADLKLLGGWYFWSDNHSGRAATDFDGHVGNGSLTIQGTTGDANLGSWQNEFPLRAGHSYAVSGWMKGRQVPADAQVQIRLDFLGSGAPIQVRNKAFLASELDRYLAWGHAHGVPLFLGEFGLFRPCFENDRGGLRWVEDMLDLAAQAGLSFTYHAYHEDGFGLYGGNGVIDPSRANQPLIDLFTRKLADGDRPPAATKARSGGR